ncbi:aminodeoxychorismate synthase component I [Neptuniibacter caesariensis]|uniref:aminodeoxychorismate synthase n=1 Tax=Neptuniibacter caesariensis TaxID=207954 RepID=A0A7U8C583_NEPCE|nr:aminodeoxychorismate synthase component I [Neptuniibacter caesariensis]EAR61815.1 para-aminobenzoate synthase component I [Neptuniibacter caesariensis]
MITQRSLPYLTSSEPYFEKVRELGQAVFLDSGRPKCPWGRFDIIAAAPVESLELDANNPDNAFDQLEALYQRYAIDLDENPDLPFQGGIIGHFAYDLGRCAETLPTCAEDFAKLPDMRVGMYLWAVVVDHHKQTAVLVADSRVSVDQIDALESRLLKESNAKKQPFSLRAPFKANMDEAGYRVKLNKVDEYIHAGDCYQVNFAQRWNSEYQGDSWQAYKQLRSAAPTPYSAFIDSGKDQILSLSPEQFLETLNGQVTTKPIKGTRPRSQDTDTDNQLKQELAESLKDRAENLMIVDLLRNDLSKVCEHNSVKVPKLFNIESYANVHHKVSTVTGKLSDKYTPIALLKHCFPGGSITGAPKIRAMEIIEELEPHRRSIYCGSIGYISLCGRMDTSITIRTLLCEDNHIYCWAGGGIVADSVSSMEYKETFDKVNNLLHCLEATIPK